MKNKSIYAFFIFSLLSIVISYGTQINSEQIKRNFIEEFNNKKNTLEDFIKIIHELNTSSLTFQERDALFYNINLISKNFCFEYSKNDKPVVNNNLLPKTYTPYLNGHSGEINNHTVVINSKLIFNNSPINIIFIYKDGSENIIVNNELINKFPDTINHYSNGKDLLHLLMNQKKIIDFLYSYEKVYSDSSLRKELLEKYKDNEFIQKIVSKID